MENRNKENRNKTEEHEIASMLMEARNTPVTPLEDDFTYKERILLKERSSAKRKKE